MTPEQLKAHIRLQAGTGRIWRILAQMGNPFPADEGTIEKLIHEVMDYQYKTPAEMGLEPPSSGGIFTKRKRKKKRYYKRRANQMKKRSKTIHDVISDEKFEEIREQIIQEAVQELGEMVIETMDEIAEYVEEATGEPFSIENTEDIQSVAKGLVSEALDRLTVDMLGDEEEEERDED